MRERLLSIEPEFSIAPLPRSQPVRAGRGPAALRRRAAAGGAAGGVGAVPQRASRPCGRDQAAGEGPAEPVRMADPGRWRGRACAAPAGRRRGTRRCRRRSRWPAPPAGPGGGRAARRARARPLSPPGMHHVGDHHVRPQAGRDRGQRGRAVGRAQHRVAEAFQHVARASRRHRRRLRPAELPPCVRAPGCWETPDLHLTGAGRCAGGQAASCSFRTGRMQCSAASKLVVVGEHAVADTVGDAPVHALGGDHIGRIGVLADPDQHIIGVDLARAWPR